MTRLDTWMGEAMKDDELQVVESRIGRIHLATDKNCRTALCCEVQYRYVGLGKEWEARIATGQMFCAQCDAESRRETICGP